MSSFRFAASVACILTFSYSALADYDTSRSISMICGGTEAVISCQKEGEKDTACIESKLKFTFPDGKMKIIAKPKDYEELSTLHGLYCDKGVDGRNYIIVLYAGRQCCGKCNVAAIFDVHGKKANTNMPAVRFLTQQKLNPNDRFNIGSDLQCQRTE